MIEHLIAQLETIQAEAAAVERGFAGQVEAARPRFRQSARNLLHYLALRQFHIQDLQDQLAGLGLSSLGRTEAHVAASLDAVLGVLRRLAGRPAAPGRAGATGVGFAEGQALLDVHIEALFGPPPEGRQVRIMVTLDDEEADNYGLVRDLLATGMDCARINCARRDERAWGQMADNVQRAGREVGRNCRILMDLGGPKLRTGPIEDLLVRPGDVLVLQRDFRPGAAGPARVPCTLPEVLADVRPGETVEFDDGKIGGLIRAANPDEVQVEIVRAKKGGSRLRADRGINLPDSRLGIRGLTAKDLGDLDFAAARADLVALSFVNEPEDVSDLQRELEKRRAGHLGILVKVETKRGFRQLPELLLAAMRSENFGVVIARGDLAVECGWERLAEVQEEILWLSEAAHCPVVWATQVLERLAKKGLPSRAEITDAAMAQRAECVLLNKGPHVLEAVRTLDDILRRMQEHQRKKTAMLRRLHISQVSRG